MRHKERDAIENCVSLEERAHIRRNVMQFFLGTSSADSTLLRSLPKRRICNVTDGYQVWIKSLLQIGAITSEKYIQPNASQFRKPLLFYTATYVQLGEETAKVFSPFFYLFPFPMLPAASAPSLPSPSQPNPSPPPRTHRAAQVARCCRSRSTA